MSLSKRIKQVPKCLAVFPNFGRSFEERAVKANWKAEAEEFLSTKLVFIPVVNKEEDDPLNIAKKAFIAYRRTEQNFRLQSFCLIPPRVRFGQLKGSQADRLASAASTAVATTWSAIARQGPTRQRSAERKRPTRPFCRNKAGSTYNGWHSGIGMIAMDMGGTEPTPGKGPRQEGLVEKRSKRRERFAKVRGG